MTWIILFIAGLFEVGWAVGLKYTNGFTNPVATVFTAVALLSSMALLGIALRTLPLSVAYAVWTGIGTVGTAIVGFVILKEPVTAMRIVCVVLIVAGIVGLRLSASQA